MATTPTDENLKAAVHWPTAAELAAGLAALDPAPRDAGTLALIVRRPATGARESLEKGTLTVTEGLVGDNWRARGSRGTPDGAAQPEMQITLMNARIAALIAGAPERWPLAGDQLFVDLDLSRANLPPGARLAVGTAVLEVTATPHTGCQKFADRFGRDALRLVNTRAGRAQNLRGINARVIQGGTIRVGDAITRHETD